MLEGGRQRRNDEEGCAMKEEGSYHWTEKEEIIEPKDCGHCKTQLIFMPLEQLFS